VIEAQIVGVLSDIFKSEGRRQTAGPLLAQSVRRRFRQRSRARLPPFFAADIEK
jgi:hypothetical protein